MITNDVLNFIRGNRKLGKPKEAIDAELRAGGWNDKQIAEAWEILAKDSLSSSAATAPSAPPQPARKKRSISIIAVLIALAVGVAGGWYIQPILENRDIFSIVQPLKNEITDVVNEVSEKEATVTIEEVAYFGSTKGYYVVPKAEGTYPGVVLIHDSWGLNDTVKEAAEKLANEGYQVLAVDLFGEVATTPERAKQLSGTVVKDTALKNVKSAVAFLRTKSATKVGSVGWGIGGGVSLQLALAQEKINATVMYYGSLEPQIYKLSVLTAPVLGIFGDNDTVVRVTDVQEFEQALGDYGIPHEVHIYQGVGNGFADPKSTNYVSKESDDAWQKTSAFLKKNLKGGE